MDEAARGTAPRDNDASSSAGGSSGRGRKRRGNGKRKRSASRTPRDDASDNNEQAEKPDAEQKEEGKAAAPKQWGCPACTFLNDAPRCFCEMCGTANPTPPASSASSLRLAGVGRVPLTAPDWSCAACTMVNPSAMRVCGVCGALNPRPALPAGLSIGRLTGALGRDEDFSEDDDSVDEDDDDSDEDDEEDDDEDEDDTMWTCRSCYHPASGDTCSHCCAQRLKGIGNDGKKSPGKKAERRANALVKKHKRRQREKQRLARAKMAYGVSIYGLKKLVLEPTSSRLIDTLQTLTHTLAMMDASADSEWGDVHGASLFIRGFGGGLPSSTKTAKDPELLTVLTNLFRERERKYPMEVRLLAVQSINYLMKMDRHMFTRSVMLEIVDLYITDLLAWKAVRNASESAAADSRSAQMVVEECLSGLSSLCNVETFALQELLKPGNFAGYLDFLLVLVDEDQTNASGSIFHPSIVMTALGILQRCCVKLRWSAKTGAQNSTASFSASSKTEKKEGKLTVELAAKLVDFLRRVLEHKHVPLHVKAAKCLLLMFHRTPYDRPEIIAELVTSEVLRKFVAVVVDANGDESEDSRHAMISLLLHLFDNRPQLVTLFVKENIYAELFNGMLPLLQSSSTALGASALKLTALLTRVVCRKHSLAATASSSGLHASTTATAATGEKPSTSTGRSSPRNGRNRLRLNSLPDPDVLSTLLLDFIRTDSIPAVNVLLKDGADLNFPKMFDIRGKEIDKPLHVATEHASLGMVRFLVKRGADVHQVGPHGTALHVAARTGRCDVASFLLQCGASIEAKDREKKTVRDVVNSTDNKGIDESKAESSLSPMKKLLELHQRAMRMRDDDSDLSETDEISSGRARSWFFSPEHEDEYGDEDDDELDDDELDEEEEEGYYMDYDDDEDEEDDLDRAGRRDENMEDEEIPSDEDMDDYDSEMPSGTIPSSRKRRLGSIASESEMKTEETHQDTTSNEDASVAPRHRSSSDVGNAIDDEDAVLRRQGFSATSGEIYGFSQAIVDCLLAVLHNMDIQNVERSVISTLACVLEMAPSQLIHSLKETDVVLILDTVHFLLQGDKHFQANVDAIGQQRNASAPLSGDSTASHSGETTTAAQKSNLSSFILALRILQALIRKSAADSSIFYQIERRGISEQIEQLNDSSACWVSSSQDGNSPSRGARDSTIFGRGLTLLETLRADMLESGMLHLHKLKNLARRLREFSEETSAACEKDLVLVDLVELFDQPNSITTYEFKQSELLPAVLQFLSPQGELDETRVKALMRAFERYPSALKHLIFRLQSIITQEEKFPLVSFNSGKGRELYPLTRQLKISFVRPGDRQVGGNSGRPKSKTIHSSPLTHFQSFERTISRSLPVEDADLSLLYVNLVGHSIQKVIEGKWRKFVVTGYDDTRSHHLVKPLGATDEELMEIVLHDSQCKLLGRVDVYENVTLDLELFGAPVTSSSSSGGNSDGKKKRKSNKRKRKLSAQKQQQQDSESACQVEVKNEDLLGVPKLKGAWHAAELVRDGADETSRPDEDERQTFEGLIEAQQLHSVKLLNGNRVVHKVPSECLRARPSRPQVGSVVEVDGTLGEVTRVYIGDRSLGAATDGADRLLDVRIDDDVEKVRVKERVRFPPQQAATPKYGDASDQIEAMSIRRLFPARESSLLAGSVGDRVWVSPPSGSPVKELCVAGTIKSFPSGLESIRESATVIVELSFGLTQSPLTVKVSQNQVLNFAVDVGGRSGGGSRLLAALQMVSGRGGRSRLFGSGHHAHDSSTSAFHRAFERVAGSLEQNRLDNRRGSSSAAMEQLRHLIARGGANAPSELEAPESTPSSTQDIGLISSPNERVSSKELQAEGSASTSRSNSPKMTRQQAASARDKRSSSSHQQGNAALQAYLKTDDAKPKWICSQLPKVSLVVGFRKCDVGAISPDRIIVSSAYGIAERGDKVKSNKDTMAASLLVQLNPATQRYKAKPGARQILLDVFSSFNGSTQPQASPKKKKRKIQPVLRKTAADAAPWNIEKFIAFMSAILGPAKRGASTSQSQSSANAKQCILFSKFATPASNRTLLPVDAFVSLMVHECRESAKAKLLLKYLRSRGYSDKSLSAKATRGDGDDEDEEKETPLPTDATEKSGSKILRQPVVLRGFPADQNVLKCVEDLHQEHRSLSGNAVSGSGNSSALGETALPPWKLTYKLYCDFQVEWSTQSSSIVIATESVQASTQSIETLAVLEARRPMRLLKHGIITLDGMDADGAAGTEAARWLSRTTAGGGGSRSAVVPESVASAVGLLRYLFQFRSDTGAVDEALWTSPRLYNKLETQLQDVLSMCSGIYPSWCDALVTHCKFFFPRELREKLFRATSFGCTRSLHWFRNQLNIEENGPGSNGSGSDSLSSGITGAGGIHNQEISISPIPKERVKVHRANILQSAEAVMKMHAKRKAILDLVFVGEKGYGSGVTAAFYSTTAHAIQSLKENRKSRCWIPGEDDESEAVKAEARHAEGTDVADGLADDDAVIRHANGLFPYPHRSPNAKLVERFRMMGRLAGKALMDERLLPLPLSPQFMKLVVGESFVLEELGDLFLSHGRILYSMYRASKKLAAGEQEVQIDQMDVEDWLEAVGFTFIDPFSQEPVVTEGEGIAVTVANLPRYVEAVLELWLHSGIHAQVLAFREGIGEVLPLAKLRLLFVPELLALLCGEDDIKWDVASLLKDTKLAHGYTKESSPVQYFMEVLEEMSGTQRRAFLLYATGCPNLPPGGFRALKPPFEVVRRVVDNLDVDRALPFARTCTNTLHLPAYSSKAVLAKQMTFAIANSRGVIDRD